MEQTLSERPPQLMTVNSNGAHFPQDQSVRNWSGCRGPSTPRGSVVGDQSALCRDYLRGTCTRGASCKYRHGEPGENGGPRFYRSDRGGLGSSQSYRESKENDSRGYRSRSPCRRFQRGTCYRGSSCAYLHSEIVGYDKPTYNGEGHRDNTSRISQGQEEVKKENYMRTMSFSRERRSRSPCRNFLRGTCTHGSNCERSHVIDNFVRSRTDFSSPHHERIAHNQGYDESNGHNSSKTGTFLRERRTRSPCRNFLSGRCFRGESCYHLHPVEVSDRTRHDSWRTQRPEGVWTTIGTPRFNNGNLSTNSRMLQDHVNHNHHQENHARLTKDDIQLGGNIDNKDVISRRWSSEGNRNSDKNDSGGAKREVCLRFTKGRCTWGDDCRYLHSYHKYATEPNTLDQKVEVSVMEGQKCQKSGEKFVGLCNSDEGNEELSLWSRPFKRRRSRSRSPLAPRNDFRCTNFKRDDSRVDFNRERRYNVAQFHYPVRRSHAFERPTYRVNSNPCYSEKHTSNSVGPEGNDAIAGKKDDFKSPSIDLQHNDAGQNDKDLAKVNITVDVGQGVDASNMEDLESNPGSLSQEHLVLPEAVCSSYLKEGNVELTNVENVELMASMETDPSKDISESCEGPVSCEETMKGANISNREENGSIVGNIESKVEASLDVVEVSRRKLLVLDVNGILADIVALYPPCFTPDTTISGKGVFKRPFCDEFLQFCFERYDVGIWSSRTKKNVTMVVDFLMKDTKNKLVFCWDQSHCTDTGYTTIQNRDKPLVLKELKKLWDKKEETLPWKKGYYNETNTILLDDSPYKALRNPPYTAIFPCPYSFRNVRDKSLGPGGDIRVYLERLAEAENVQKFIEENPFGQRPITKSNLSWAFYSKIIGASDVSVQQEKAEVDDNSNNIQLEEKPNIVTTDLSQPKEEAQKLEEDANIVGISKESQLIKETEILGISNTSQPEIEQEIIGTCDRIQTEETKIDLASNKSQLEEKGTCNGIEQGERVNFD